MPEIWLRYGTTDVVLDIKFENLASNITSSFRPLPEEEIMATLGSVPLTDNMLLVSLSPSKAAARTLAILAGAARAKGFTVTVDVPPRMAASLRTNLTAQAGGEAVSISRADYQSLQERIKKFQSALVVSSVAYDPLFGYAGAPTTVLRNFLPDRMSEAFMTRRDNIPTPAEEREPLKIAISSMEGIAANSIELVASGSGIAGIHSGSVAEAFAKAKSQLRAISAVEADPVKCAILSASSESGSHSALSVALNSLWNALHIVRQGGSAILLAECREGLGGGALQMYVEGRLKAEQLGQTPYVDGLEHLLYLRELGQKYELGIVSTLPHYYTSRKLGFSIYASMKDIMERLPDRHGKNYKAIVMSDADITLLRAKI